MSTDSCCDFLGEHVHISYQGKFTSFPSRSIKRCSLRQNSEYSSLKYALSTHLFCIQPVYFCTLSPCVQTALNALLDRRQYFWGCYLCDVHKSVSFPIAEYCTDKGSKGWLSVRETFFFILSIQHQETLLEKSSHCECEIHLYQRQNVCVYIKEFCWFSVCQASFLVFCCMAMSIVML